VGLLMPAVARVRDAGPRMLAQNRLKEIGLALHSYADDHGGRPCTDRTASPSSAGGCFSCPTWVTRTSTGSSSRTSLGTAPQPRRARPHAGRLRPSRRAVPPGRPVGHVRPGVRGPGSGLRGAPGAAAARRHGQHHPGRGGGRGRRWAGSLPAPTPRPRGRMWPLRPAPSGSSGPASARRLGGRRSRGTTARPPAPTGSLACPQPRTVRRCGRGWFRGRRGPPLQDVATAPRGQAGGGAGSGCPGRRQPGGLAAAREVMSGLRPASGGRRAPHEPRRAA
jgi:hypothetical protein